MFPLFQLQDIWAQPERLNIHEYVEIEAYHSYFKFCNVKKKKRIKDPGVCCGSKTKKKKKKRKSATAVTLRETQCIFLDD